MPNEHDHAEPSPRHPQARQSLGDDCIASLRLAIGREPEQALRYDKYLALALAVRGRQMSDWLRTEASCRGARAKRVHYLSLEFLNGRALQNAVINLELQDEARTALWDLGVALEDVYEEEIDVGLGNGGLGRLAACFLDSLATRGYPAVGYGIRYQYGMFQQEIRDGVQVERPDNWLVRGSPWETPRPEERILVGFGGHCDYEDAPDGGLRVHWHPASTVWALPYETLVPGWQNAVANPLILWRAVSSDEFNLQYFNDGDYLRAVEEKARDETISQVLYPNDQTQAGRELRLKQQYFFVAASLARILEDFLDGDGLVEELPDGIAVHLNDTHPTVAIPELMRLLMDHQGLGWEQAWDLVRRVFSYTNHTLMPEALECWDVDLFQRLLPRHFDIICEINRRFLDEIAARWPGDGERVARMSIFQEGDVKRLRMAHLALIGSHSVNGVAELHSELLRRGLFRDFHDLWPDRFGNVTNGVTQRRWLLQANPSLARLISESIGEGWITDLERLRDLEPLADDAAFRQTWADLKRGNGDVLAKYLEPHVERLFDPDSLIDVQIKRIHEYKRQPDEPAAGARPLPAHHRRAQRRLGAAHRAHGRQGRAGVLDGEAHHPPGQRPGPLHRCRPRRARSAAAGVRAQLRCLAGRAHLPGQRPIGADLHRRHRGVGYRQHEVCAQRCADHRHHGRRQYRDLQRGRAREHVRLRAR